MSKACSLTGKRVMRGNNVSHAHNKTRRSFEPNLQSTRLYSNILQRHIRLRIAASTLRTIDKKGGLDEFLLGYRNAKLAEQAKKLKRTVLKSLAKNKPSDKDASSLVASSLVSQSNPTP